MLTYKGEFTSKQIILRWKIEILGLVAKLKGLSKWLSALVLYVIITMKCIPYFFCSSNVNISN